MKKYLKLNYLLGIITLVQAVSKLFEPMELINISGIIFYLTATAAFFFKPKIGYFLLVIIIIFLIFTLAVNFFVNSY